MIFNSSFLKYILDIKFIASSLLISGLLGIMYYLGIDKKFIFLVITIAFSLSLVLINKNNYEKVASGGLLGVLLVVLGYYLSMTWSTFHSITEWDFLAFYVYGKAGADGLTLYDPSSFVNILEKIQYPVNVSQGFDSAIIKVGVCYPPTTMLFLTPFGYLDLYSANIAWRLFVLLFLVLDLFLIIRYFRIHEKGWVNALIAAVLLLMMPGSSTTVALSQTNFFLLFFIILTFLNMQNWKAGMFLAFAVVIKPIAVIWALYFLVHRRWKQVIAFAITGITLVLLTVAWFGLGNFLDFFITPPTQRIPDAVFVETINQSMNAVFSRIADSLQLGNLIGSMDIIVIVASVVLLLLTTLASFRFERNNPEIAFLIFLPLSLLIYPGCLMHYAVQLIPLVLYLIVWREKNTFWLLAAFFIALSFSSFLASLIILSVLLWKGFRMQQVSKSIA